MLDFGLLITGLMIWVGLSAAARWAPVEQYQRADLLDKMYWPLIAGVLAARVAAVTLDDPASLRSIRALLVIRGGVEFWAGVAVVLATLSRTTRRSHGPRWSLALAELAPFALWAYAIYEAGCVYRDGCYGPTSAIGLVPDGLQERQVPIGVLVGASIALLGVAISRSRTASSVQRVLLAIGGVAVVRSVASIWLPRLGDGLTRQHIESIIVTVLAAVSLAWSLRRRHDVATPQSEPSHDV